MTTGTAILAALIPAALVVLALVALRQAGPPGNASPRLLLVLEAAALGMLALVYALQFLPEPSQRYLFWIYMMFIPVIFGTIILALMHFPLFFRLGVWEKAAAVLLGLAAAASAGYYLREPSSVMMALPGAAATLLAAWLFGVRPARWVWILPVVVIALWWAFNKHIWGYPMSLLGEMAILVNYIYILTPVLSVAVLAVFAYTGVVMLSNPPSEGQFRSIQVDRVEGLLRVLAALLMLVLLNYSTLWASIWDQTSDGMGGLVISHMVGVLAIATGMVMGLLAAGPKRLVGLAFAGIVAGSTYLSFMVGWDLSFEEITAQRAERIAAALERYHQRESRYPLDLAELSPRDMLHVPLPVMFKGEGWCYQGGEDDYTLAAFFHTYFGMPVSLKVYASTENREGQPLPCEERLAEMRDRYDWTRSYQREDPP